MKLEGIKVNFLGDSITEGVGVPDVDHTYWRVMQDLYGISVARGYGISGTRLARQHHPTVEKPRYDLDFCSRVAEMDPDADLVVVFGGTNDFDHGDAPIGTYDDRTPDTFYGACHVLMQSLIEKYPDSTIVFMTPLHRLMEQKAGKEDLCVYVNIIKEVAEHYGLPVMDLFSNSGLQPQIPVIREKYVPDGLHPNSAGARRIAERLGNFLLAL